MPIPENVAYYRTCADEYLYTLAPVFGEIRTIADPQGCYRVHGDNGYSSLPFRKKLELEILGYNEQCAALHATLARNGIHVDVEEWKRHSWFHRLERALIEVQHWIPENCSLVLIDGETWGNDWRDGHRSSRPFVDVEGIDWGPPAESQSAIERLGRLVDLGVQYLVLAWPSFWWLDEYADFFQYLQRHSTCLASNDAIQIYELAPVSPSKTGKLELRVPAAQGGR
jgi:hypothetical protein